jgi:hypothetical protein
MLAISGNWGWIKTGRSRGSRRRRIALTIACIGVGLVLVVLLGQLGIASSPDITRKVLFIVGLLVVGVVVGLRPWSES